MATELSPLCLPVDLVMGRKTFDVGFNAFSRDMSLGPNHPEADDMIFEYRDRSNDEAEETLREESEYWHGMSVVESWELFELED